MDKEVIATQLHAGWQDMTAAAAHWGEDQEFAEELLAAAIQHYATADALLGNMSYEDFYIMYWED